MLGMSFLLAPKTGGFPLRRSPCGDAEQTLSALRRLMAA
jgi:hypothetical protein